MKRRIWIMFVLLLLIPGRAEAQEEGSLHLTMRWSGEAVSGGAVAVYDASGLDPEADLQWLARYAQACLTPLEAGDISQEGTAVFLDLAPGTYLLVQDRAAQGYLPIQPFLFTVPVRIADETVYCIEAAPKLSPVPDTFLPQTGQVLWPIWLLGGMGILLLGTGLWIGKKE